MTDIWETTIAINGLAARYADAVNRWDRDQLATCFTSDVTWSAGPLSAQGRPAVLDLMTSVRERFDWLIQTVGGVNVVDVGEAGATCRVYATEWSMSKREGAVLLGEYHDRCVCDDGDWRFTRRVLDVLYQGPAHPILAGRCRGATTRPDITELEERIGRN